MKSHNQVYFPGSFDPFTLGHLSIVKQLLHLFSSVTVLVCSNSSKNHMLSETKRAKLVSLATQSLQNVSVDIVDNGLLVDYFKNHSNHFLIARGLRSAEDFNYESQMAYMNKYINNQCLTMFLQPSQELSHINSSLVRQIIHQNGDLTPFLPKAIIEEVA